VTNLGWTGLVDRREACRRPAILTTWQISFDRIRSKRPSAADLLSLIWFLDSQGIPRNILKPSLACKKATRTNTPASLADTDVDFQEDLVMLKDYFLIVSDETGDVFSMHALVQLLTRRWLEAHGRQETFQQQCIDRLAASFPTAEYDNWETCRRLFPHAQVAFGCQPSEDKMEWASLFHNTGWFARLQGRYIVAELMTRGALHGCGALEKGHPLSLEWMADLALILHDQRRHKEAESLCSEVLHMREKLLGREHRDTIISVSNLASILSAQGRYQDAERENRKALEVMQKETVFAKDDPDTLNTWSNLASVLREQGKYHQAETIYQQQLEAMTRRLSRNHPDTLVCMNNFAWTLQSQAKFKEAELINRQALERMEGVFEKKHPTTLTCKRNLAVILQHRGKSQEAYELSRQVLETAQKELGEKHPDTLISCSYVATILELQGKFKEAEGRYREVLEGIRGFSGELHPNYLTALANLCNVLRSQGKHDEVEQIRRQALEMSVKLLGEEHPVTKKFGIERNTGFSFN